MKFKNYLEAFERTEDFLLNKDYSDKQFSQLLKDFEESGGKEIGVGRHGSVYSHPNWNYVLKTFENDNCYLRFVRFAVKNPLSAFPKFYGVPKKIYPQYLRLSPLLYYVRMERLYPIENKEFLEWFPKYFWHGAHDRFLNFNPEYAKWQKELKRKCDEDYEKKRQARKNKTPYVSDVNCLDVDEMYLKELEFIEKNPGLWKVIEGFKAMQNQNFKCAFDIHSGNIMQRANGELVLIDPLWYGSNPYMDAMQARKMETDDFNYDDYDHMPLFKGGQRKLKKPRIKQQIQNPTYYDDDPWTAPF
jgi:hypothetical protein